VWCYYKPLALAARNRQAQDVTAGIR